MKTYRVTLTLTEPMLGTAPADGQVYTNYIVSKKLADEKNIAKKTNNAEALAVVAEKELALAKEEVALLPEQDKGITVFRRDKNGLIIMDYMIRGFLKESGTAISGIWGLKSKIDKWCFVKERTIPIMRDGKQVTEADAVLERPLRAETMQGPRTTLAASEVVNAQGTTLTFHLMVLPLGETDKKCPLTLETLKSWLEYGQFCGCGQWRSGSYGRFTAEIEQV